MKLPIISDAHKTKARRDGGHNERWHAIYKTATGLDYCREDAPASVVTKEQAGAWAQSSFDTAAPSAKASIASVKLECW